MAGKRKPDRGVNTQGGAHTEGRVSISGGDFIAGDQNKVVINGPVSGGVISVGAGNTVHASELGPASLENLTALVKEIRALLPQASLEADAQEAVAADLQTVETQMSKPAPKKALVLPKLKSIVEILGSAAAASEAVSKLIPMVNQAIQWAQQVLK